jgi:hypothetical protein
MSIFRSIESLLTIHILVQLLDLQKKVRSDISAEYWLHKKCAYPERQLFDWGMMRIQYPFAMYGIGDSFLMDADDVHRKKRFTEVCVIHLLIIRLGSLDTTQIMMTVFVLSNFRGCQDLKRKKRIRQI